MSSEMRKWGITLWTKTPDGGRIRDRFMAQARRLHWDLQALQAAAVNGQGWVLLKMESLFEMCNNILTPLWSLLSIFSSMVHT